MSRHSPLINQSCLAHSGLPEACPRLETVLDEVREALAPVWPLRDYVAVNPYFGLASRSFMSARAYLKVFSSCETLMPLEHHAELVRSGELELADLEQALAEIAWPSSLPRVPAGEIIQRLQNLVPAQGATADDGPAPAIRPVSAHASAFGQRDWNTIVIEEISRFCAAHHDRDQASWGNGWKDLPLYQAWREITQIDRNADFLGMTTLRGLAATLPADPVAAIGELLDRLRVPAPLWTAVLLSEAFSIPGWSAWARYQDDTARQAGREPQSLAGLLAIRLAYDLAVGEAVGLAVDWGSWLKGDSVSFPSEEPAALQEAWIRYALLRASEIRYRRRLLSSLQLARPRRDRLPAVQMVFCIDVRSERIRRHLESQSQQLETCGFAGFFGLPMAFRALAEKETTSQLPVLLQPQMEVQENLVDASEEQQKQARWQRLTTRTWRKLWQTLRTSSIGSFGYVESTGWLAGWQLLQRKFGMGNAIHPERDGLPSASDRLRPGSAGKGPLSGQQLEEYVELASRILGNLGMSGGCSRLVVFCGHCSQSSNNPLAAGLDCGACGGHSGAPNARWLAWLLNQPEVRTGLCNRGCLIPAETHFLAAVHNTTTDAITFPDQADLPASHAADFAELVAWTTAASRDAALERMPQLGAHSLQDLLRRASDWSEVRPEWGLAGNAALIVGPRSLTSPLHLDGRVFLHNYDASRDPAGNLLETILTAPMIVANWINMQYYASTVDNRHFGSGSKAIHNVVGKFGILSGNSGDLKTGLPLQSLHDGTRLRHQPLRLLVVVAATRASIDRIMAKHELVANLLHNEWLSMIAIDDGRLYRLDPKGSWLPVDDAGPNSLDAA